MNRKILFGFIICVLMIVSACSNNSEISDNNGQSSSDNDSVNVSNENNESESQNQTEPEQIDEPAEVVFWSSSRIAPEVFDDKYGDPIREQFPHYTIKYIQRVPDQTDLEQLFASGQRVDVIFEFFDTVTSRLIKNELQYDMTDLVEKHDVDLTRVEPSMIDAIKNLGDGELYGLPVSTKNYAMYYNKDMLDQFGVEHPTDGMTWSELNDLASRVTRTENGQTFVGFTPSMNHMLILNPFSLALVDKETNRSTYNDERWKTILETELLQFSANNETRQLMEEVRNGGLLGSGQFVSGHVAMSIRSNGIPNADFDWEIASIPHYEEMPNVGYQSNPTYFSITNTAENKDAAMQVLNYLISDEYQIEKNKLGEMTVLKDEAIKLTYAQETEASDKNWGAFFFNTLAPASNKTVVEDLLSKRAYESLKDRLGHVIMGTMDLNTALRESEEEVNRNIDEFLAQ